MTLEEICIIFTQKLWIAPLFLVMEIYLQTSAADFVGVIRQNDGWNYKSVTLVEKKQNKNMGFPLQRNPQSLETHPYLFKNVFQAKLKQRFPYSGRCFMQLGTGL